MRKGSINELRDGVMKNEIVLLRDDEVKDVVAGEKVAAPALTRSGGSGVIRVLLVIFLGPLGTAIFADISRVSGGLRGSGMPGRTFGSVFGFD